LLEEHRDDQQPLAGSLSDSTSAALACAMPAALAAASELFLAGEVIVEAAAREARHLHQAFDATPSNPRSRKSFPATSRICFRFRSLSAWVSRMAESMAAERVSRNFDDDRQRTVNLKDDERHRRPPRGGSRHN
jgi:hypothetical protein